MKNKNVVVAISGGIAAYKSAELVSRLKKQGCNVKCVMTKHAKEFITPLTLETLSGNAVISDMFEKHDFEVEHIALAKWADIFVIAPATANVIGKISAGIADDFLTTVVMATKAPVFFAPAMNDAMYDNPIVQRNITFLKEIGYHFIEPTVGNLACGTVGKGKMAEPEVICEVIVNFSEQDLEKVMADSETAERKGGKLGEQFENFKLLWGLLKDYYNKKYPHAPWRLIASIGFAVAYLVSPIDVIPDFIPVAGFIDDASIFAMIVKAFEFDINEYKNWLKK